MACSLRVILLGTSTFVLPILNSLQNSIHEIVAVVTRPPRKAGRGRKLRQPPVAEAALHMGIDLMQPVKLSSDFVHELRKLSPDIMISADFGAWLSEELLEVAPYGVMNVHPSLLPKHRGAAPVARTILDGDTVTGVTFMLTDQGWDTGPIVQTFPENVRPDDTAGILEARLALLSSDRIEEVIDGYTSGLLKPVPQSGEADYADKLNTEETWLDWQRPASELERMIRAFQPSPGARTRHSGRLLKIIRAALSSIELEPGTVRIGPGLLIGCGRGSLEILELQPEGKRVMSSEEFLRGSRLRSGDGFD